MIARIDHYTWIDCIHREEYEFDDVSVKCQDFLSLKISGRFFGTEGGDVKSYRLINRSPRTKSNSWYYFPSRPATMTDVTSCVDRGPDVSPEGWMLDEYDA